MRNRAQKALYGNVALDRTWCPSCRAMSLVVAGRFACCDAPAELVGQRPVRMTQPPHKRKGTGPSAERKREILDAQGYRCIYCGQEFGSWITYNGKLMLVAPVWDHAVPFVCDRNNHDANFVAACRPCNSAKWAHCYDTIEDARDDILDRRKRHRRDPLSEDGGNSP